MNRVVYSTDKGRLCPNCSQIVSQCHCQALAKQQIVGDGVVRIRRETKGRKGKGVTLISGLPLNANDLKKLAKELKQRCGTGGAVKNQEIEIQGDHGKLLQSLLADKGFQAKLAGY